MLKSPETPTLSSKTPSHAAYHIRERKGGVAYWNRIGSAWQHSDGNGFNIQIAVVPLDRRIGLRAIAEKVE